MNGFDASTALTDLVRNWSEQRPWTVNIMTYSFDPVDVAEVLAATITEVEPYRSHVLEDAREWLALPFFGGLGRDFGVEDVEIVPHSLWERSISPFRFWVNWQNVMSAMDPAYHVEYRRESWERVVHEGGRWKIASLWSDAARDRVRQEVEQIKRFQNRD